jgi:hypothetical protein
MQNSERQPFDESWRSAFDGANLAPSDKLWNSIEADLAGSETATMKKRVVFYQRLAAATVIFALLSGAYAVYNYKSTKGDLAIASEATKQTTTPAESSVDPKAQIPTTTKEGGTQSLSFKKGNASHTPSRPRRKDEGNESTNPPGSASAGNEIIPFSPEQEQVVQSPATNSADSAGDGFLPKGLTEVAEPNDNSVALNEEQQPAPVLLSADQINALAEAHEKDEKAGINHSPWLGVGAAAGSFAPNAVVNDGMIAAATADYNTYYASQGIPQSYSETVGSAYSAGVSAGVRIAKRWVLQSGLNYINQRVDYTTTFVGVSGSNQASAMTKEYIGNTNMDVMVTSPYQVSSATEILSIPVQAGFLIVDRKIGWQVSSGIATDFLLRNTLTDKSGVRSRVTESAGEDSPYRAVNWAGMLNTEVSCKIGEHYRIAIVPGFRYAFKPMLKADTNGTPLILDVGFRLKYLFN